jgi:ribosomal protein L17
MTDEERQRQMDFIIEQQAQFAADVQRLEASDERAGKRLDRLERVVKLAVRAGLRTRRDVRDQLTALVDSHVRLAAAQIKTEDALQRLADSVARHTADGHGGPERGGVR